MSDLKEKLHAQPSSKDDIFEVWGVEFHSWDMPTCVTRADVLDYCARVCSSMALGIWLFNERARYLRYHPHPRAIEELEVLDTKLPAVDLQIRAVKEAAAFLRKAATDDRVLAARTAADLAEEEMPRD